MRKAYSKYMLIFILCGLILGINTIKTKAKNSSIRVKVLVGNVEDIIENVILDDGTALKNYKKDIIIEKSNKPTNFLSIKRENSFITPFYFGGYNDYFKYAAWITRDGVDTLSLEPTDSVRYNRSTAETAWGIISNSNHGLGWHTGFKNYTSLTNQYYCHFNFAKFKDRWNLEPHRPVVDDFTISIRLCNP